MDFKIQTDHLIPARAPELMLIKKKELAGHIENIEKYLDLARERKKRDLARERKKRDLARERKKRDLARERKKRDLAREQKKRRNGDFNCC